MQFVASSYAGVARLRLGIRDAAKRYSDAVQDQQKNRGRAVEVVSALGVADLHGTAG
jgi:hypothetical protein